jgi:filamentous hemagglutinin family protein
MIKEHPLAHSVVNRNSVRSAETTHGLKVGGYNSKAAIMSVLLCGLLGVSTSHGQSVGPSGGDFTLPTGYALKAGKVSKSYQYDKMTYQVGKNKPVTFHEHMTMHINQTTQRAVIDWTDFSIGRKATVDFHQPNASAVTLNRVNSLKQSVINGELFANGHVYILNANGILFNNSARVNVGGLVASTLGISNDDFMAGKTVFTGTGRQGSVTNLGELTSADGGYIALQGKKVSNGGVITTKRGTSILTAGDKLSLEFYGDFMAGYVNGGSLGAYVENKNTIIADGGQIYLKAIGLGTEVATVVNNTGLLRANTVDNRKGQITLQADTENDRIYAGGTIATNGLTGVRRSGGLVELVGAYLQYEPDAVQNANGRTLWWITKGSQKIAK